MAINPIFEQIGNNILVMLLGIFIIAFTMKGFFWQYLRVRLSFGRLTLVKIRAVNRDYFKVGEIIDGFLVYPTKTGHKRISIKDSSYLYRSMAITWIDVDEEQNAIAKPDFSTVSGFDAEKYDNLYKRTLYRPSASDAKEKLLFTLVFISIIAAIAAAVLSYFGMRNDAQIMSAINGIANGLVVPTG